MSVTARVPLCTDGTVTPVNIYIHIFLRKFKKTLFELDCTYSTDMCYCLDNHHLPIINSREKYIQVLILRKILLTRLDHSKDMCYCLDTGLPAVGHAGDIAVRAAVSEQNFPCLSGSNGPAIPRHLQIHTHMIIKRKFQSKYSIYGTILRMFSLISSLCSSTGIFICTQTRNQCLKTKMKQSWSYKTLLSFSIC